MTTKWPIATVRRRYEFHARHWLKCSADPAARMDHTHIYFVTVIMKSEFNPHTDWMVYDFPKIDRVVAPILRKVHEKSLNTVLPHDVPPTSEAVAYWILCQLPAWIDGLELSENPHSSVEVYRRSIREEWRKKLLRDTEQTNLNSD